MACIVALLDVANVAQTSSARTVEVHSDRRVTFKLDAFRAAANSKVEVLILGRPTMPMSRGDDGVWTAVIGPLDPGIYQYNIRINGVLVTDMGSTAVDIGTQIHRSILEVPGDSPRIDEWRPVPHGVLHRHQYLSMEGQPRRMFVFTPPGYDSGDRRYPVLYLLHGNGHTEASWSEIGRAPTILENLLATTKTVPMLIVMPIGYSDSLANPSAQVPEDTERIIISEVVPFIERTYRVKSNSPHRAIAGVSMGGTQALAVGLRHPKIFGAVAAFSTRVFSERAPDVVFDSLSASKRSRDALPMLFLSCGESDERFAGNQAAVEFLKNHQVKHVWFATPGAHEWSVWRRSIAELMPLLFR